MKIRSDIVDLLRAGVPQIQIARQLHCAPITVQRTREAIGMPSPGRGRRDSYASVEDVYRAHSEAIEDGHARWNGPTDASGHPRLNLREQRFSARQIAFRMHRGRDPQGNVSVGCGMAQCIAGAHIEDQAIRDANRRADVAFKVIFGPAP